MRINSDGSETSLTTGGNVLISNSPADVTVTSTLTFSVTDLTLIAGYVCVAMNSIDSDRATAQLVVNGRLYLMIVCSQILKGRAYWIVGNRACT